MKKALSTFLNLILMGMLSVCAGCAAPAANESPDMTPTVQLRVDNSEFSITDANGNRLTHQDDFSGSLTIMDQSYIDTADKTGGEYILVVPSSEQFRGRRISGDRQIFGVAIYEEDDVTEYSVSGTGIDQIALDCDGNVSFSGDGMVFTVFLSMPCDGLGELGCVRFSGTAKSDASFSVSEDVLEFTGVEPGSGSISYAGDGTIKNPNISLDTDYHDGTIDFSNAADGNLTLTVAGGTEKITVD